MKLVQFGAGNIGRSFIGQLFSRAGYEVVFVDIDERLVRALNERRQYRVEIRDENPETLTITNVRAVHGADRAAVAEELADAAVAGTAVGPAALENICPALAKGLVLRLRCGAGPLDVIICENMRNAAQFMREKLAALLPPDFPLDDYVGLVETSIGKMVPIISDEQRAKDPLCVYAESYNTLICDALAFKNPIPQVPGLDPKTNMPAYVDRKLFIHNLGHALVAYFGHLELPGAVYVYQAVEHEPVRSAARRGMWESARGLIAEYPEEFNEENLGAHIEDLLRRFANRALGDTIFRVGRDICRKLSREDRLIGPLLLAAKHGLPAPTIVRGAAAAMLFRGRDEYGELDPLDRRFAQEIYPRGPEYVLRHVSGLDPRREGERALIRAICSAHDGLAARLSGRG